LFRLKHRLIEFLVSQLGFTAVAFEASHAGCLAIDTYLRHGTGDPAAALTGQGYLAWDCEEVQALMATLHRYNSTTEPARHVTFWGLDSGYNAAGREIISRQLDRIKPALRLRTLDTFSTLDDLESQWPFRLNEPEFEVPLREAHQVLNELEQALTEARVATADAGEDAQARRLLTMMRRWTGPERHDRSRQMGEALLNLIDESPEECRVVVWAHNGHIGRGADPDSRNLGDLLTERFGSGYVPLALEFGTGSVHMRRMDADLASGDLLAKTVEPAPVGSLPWCLSATGHQVLAVNLRDRRPDPILEDWLGGMQIEHGIGWTHTESSQYYEQCHLVEKYDGIAFVQSSSPTHPTPNARQAVANRERY
jgi:erythromycin esterase